MPEQNTNRALTEAAADEWKVLPSGLTVLVRPMPGYSGTHVIYATRFGSIDRDFRVDGREVHLPAGVAHFLEHKMFEDEDGDAFVGAVQKQRLFFKSSNLLQRQGAGHHRAGDQNV